jgi:hypothetical protein
VQRVIIQAEKDRVRLSEVERCMLIWSESDSDFEPNLKLAGMLQEGMSDDEFEAKIGGLIKRAYH